MTKPEIKEKFKKPEYITLQLQSRRGHTRRYDIDTGKAEIRDSKFDMKKGRESKIEIRELIW